MYNTSITPEGTFEIPNVLVGLFDIYIKIDGYIQSESIGFELISGDNEILMSAPVSGDLNGDNGVNIVDVSVMNAAFGSNPDMPNYNYLADMNCDGGVNIVDVSILNGSFGLVGAQP